MNINQLHQTTTNRLIITDSKVIHLILDFDIDLANVLYKIGLNLSNCSGIVCPKGKITINNKIYDLTRRYNELKINIEKQEDKLNKINILLNVKEIPNNKFVIFDHYDISLQAKLFLDKFNNKKACELISELLKIEYTKYKRKYPNVNHEFLMVTSADKFIGHQDVKTIYDILPYLKDLNEADIFFDTNFISSIITEDEAKIQQLAFILDNKLNIFRMNITDILRYLSELTKIQPAPTTSGTETAISKDIINSLKPQNDYYRIDNKKLSKLNKLIDIKNKYTIKNIEHYVNEYLKIAKNNVDNDDINLLVLKAINYSLHGSLELDKKYINQPEILINQLYDSENYIKNLNPPTVLENYSLDLKDIISLKTVTAPVRKQFEFNENIHKNIIKLFKTISENVEQPIEIVDFKHEYKTDNVNSIIEYTITLKNLNGGETKPYDVVIKVPKLVNDKYFKLNGKYYIMSNQMFTAPITKTSKNECKFLSNYSMITLEIINMKYDLSDIKSIIDYISNKYPSIIDSKSDTSITFTDSLNTTIYLSGDDILINDKMKIYYDPENDHNCLKLVNSEKNELLINKNEIIFNELLRILHEVDPKNNLSTTTKSIPYIRARIQGVKIPLILYMAQQIGLLNALTKFGIDYSINDNSINSDNSKIIQFVISDNNILFVKCKSKKDELIANGLLLIKNNKNIKIDDINSRNAFDTYLNNKYGSRTTYNFDRSVKYHIDIITKELLEFEKYPTNVNDIICDVMVDKLLNDKIDDLNDLNIYRSRQSEIISNLLYKELRQSHARYSQAVQMGDNSAKLIIVDNWIIKSLLGLHPSTKGNSILTHSNTFNPIAELKDDTKVIKSGPGGIPNKLSYKVGHRGIHESHYGNIGANDTVESSEIGINIKHSLNVAINNKYGYYQNKNIQNLSGWDVVSIGESLTPFINTMDSTRVILSTTHAGQSVSIKNPEIPIVSTGINFMLPQIISKKFGKVAEFDGKVIDVKPNKYLEIQYNNGKKDIIDLIPRITSTKRALFIEQSLNSLQPNETFKKGQMLCWTDMFNGEGYVHGKNLTMAVMNYIGFSHEDGYVVSENIIDDYSNKYLKELVVIIPENAKVLRLIKNNVDTKPNDILVEFTFDKNVDDYIENYDILNSDLKNENEDENNNLEYYESTNKTIKIKSPGGKIKQIKMYVNRKKDLDANLLLLHKSIVSDIKHISSKLLESNSVDALDNLDTMQIKIGGHKHNNSEFDGTKLIYYIEVDKYLEVGDKLSNRYGAKGIITKIISKENTPTGDYSGNIDIFLSPVGLLGRKNFSILKELYIGKILMNFNKIIKSLFNTMSIDNIKKLIIDVYSLLDPTKDKRITNSIKHKLSTIKTADFKNQITNNSFKFIIIYEPFENISFKNIREAAKLINLPLDEKVYIPELKTYTKRKVPVGCQYIQLMEQFGRDYHSARSTGKYKYLTGQPIKGKKNIGGQTVGPLDIFALLSYEKNQNMLKELLVYKSDAASAKRMIYDDILNNGKLVSQDFTVTKTKSDKLKDTFMYGLGLTTSNN